MVTTNYQQQLPASADDAWAVFSRFEDFLVWHPLEVKLEVVGSGIGMVRTLVIPDFGRVGERLDKLDHQHKLLQYTLVEGTPLGMQTYSAAIEFEPIDSHRCNILWTGQFTVTQGADEHTVQQSLRGSYVGMSTALAGYLTDGTNEQ